MHTWYRLLANGVMPLKGELRWDMMASSVLLKREPQQLTQMGSPRKPKFQVFLGCKFQARSTTIFMTDSNTNLVAINKRCNKQTNNHRSVESRAK